jgi:hypothetical protein
VSVIRDDLGKIEQRTVERSTDPAHPLIPHRAKTFAIASAQKILVATAPCLLFACFLRDNQGAVFDPFYPFEVVVRGYDQSGDCCSFGARRGENGTPVSASPLGRKKGELVGSPL